MGGEHAAKRREESAKWREGPIERREGPRKVAAERGSDEGGSCAERKKLGFEFGEFFIFILRKTDQGRQS